MNRSETISLREALQSMFAQEPDLYEGVLERRVAEVVPRVLGAVMADITQVSVRDGVLYLRSESSVVRHALRAQWADLLRRINREIGADLLRELWVGS